MIEGDLGPIPDGPTGQRLLLHRAVRLLRGHRAKEAKWRAENDVSPECGCLTREATYLAGLAPRLLRFGITMDDVAKLLDEEEHDTQQPRDDGRVPEQPA